MMRLIKKLFKEKYTCPKHGYKLAPFGYYKMICEVPFCNYQEYYPDGNLAYNGRAQDYYLKNKEKFYKKGIMD